MKTVLFLLLLDYSGSMEQLLEGTTKHQRLNTEVQALLMSASDNSKSSALVFGSEPKMGCKDLREFSGTTVNLAAQLKVLRPGNQGRTPLSMGLLRTARLAMKNRAENVVVVTDGGDSCGQDPCKALEQADRELNGSKRKLTVHIVGFDLKSERGKLECLNALRLKNIDLKISEAGNSQDLQDLFKKSRADDVSETTEAAGADAARIKGLSRSRFKYKDQSKGDKRKNEGKAQDHESHEARIEIQGAPSDAAFRAQSGPMVKNWLGSYVVALKPGLYTIRFVDPNGAELSLNLPAGTHTKIPWARLMKNSYSEVTLSSASLSLKWQPQAGTELIHGDLEEFESAADLSGNNIRLAATAFGEWQVEVTSPPWLKSVLPAKKVTLPLGVIQVEIEKLFSAELIWVKNPDPTKPVVLSMQKPKAVSERHFIGAGQERLPVPRGVKVQWLRPRGAL